MIVRLVALHFKPNHGEEFLRMFSETCGQIRGQRGCLYLSLLRSGPDDFVTVSHWQNVQDLDAYRHSELFGSIWPRLKVIFREPAWADSFHVVPLPVHNSGLEMAHRLVESLTMALSQNQGGELSLHTP